MLRALESCIVRDYHPAICEDIGAKSNITGVHRTIRVGKPRNLSEVGEAASQVRVILEGSVQKGGNVKVRVNVQLTAHAVAGDSGSWAWWKRQHDRDVIDIFRIESEINT